MTDICGKYEFTIRKDIKWYIAELKSPNGDVGFTEGADEEEVFNMISDCLQTMMDVRISWWNRLLWGLMSYGKEPK